MESTPRSQNESQSELVRTIRPISKELEDSGFPHLSRFFSVLSDLSKKANEFDASPEKLREAYRLLGRSGFLALRRPAKWGTPESSNAEYFLAKLLIARTSGALAFLFAQTGSAVGMISSSTNENVKARILSGIHLGSPGLGIAYAHCRRRGNVPLRATPCPGGYLLNGTIPWVTGLGFFDEIVAGAELPDGRHVLGLLPFKDAKGLRFGELISLASMEVTATCEAKCEGYFLDENELVGTRSPNWMEELDEQKILDGCSFVLGCAGAGVAILERLAIVTHESVTKEAANKIAAEYDELLRSVFSALRNQSASREEQLCLRGACHNLSTRTAFAAIVATSGRANLKSHDAQRIYREALAWAVLAQSRSVREATLKNLAGL